MSEEHTYSSSAALQSPRRFLRLAIADLTIVPAASWRLFVRMVQARYRQSILQWAWLVLPPLVTTTTWVFLGAAGILNHKHTQIPYAAYVGVGTVVWQFFLDSLNGPLRSLDRATLVLKTTRLPHEAWIVAGALDALVNLAVRLVLVLVLIAALGSIGGLTLLLVPLALLSTLILGLGLGIILAVIGRLYADVAQALLVGTGVWFFITPIVYSVPKENFVRHVVDLNPLTPIVLSARGWITGTGGARPIGFAVVSVIGFLLLLAGWLLYRVARPHLVERM